MKTEPPRPPEAVKMPTLEEQIPALVAQSEAVWLCEVDLSDGTNIFYKAKQPIVTNATSRQITNGQILQTFRLPGKDVLPPDARWPDEVFVFVSATSNSPVCLAVSRGRVLDQRGTGSRAEVLKLIERTQQK
jgi:hypothetical protein